MKTICNYCGSLKEGIQTGMCEHCGKLGKTNRKLALEWWYNLMTITKISLTDKYYSPKVEFQLTDEEIKYIWDKEISNNLHK